MSKRSICMSKFAGVTHLSIKDPRDVELEQKHMQCGCEKGSLGSC